MDAPRNCEFSSGTGYNINWTTEGEQMASEKKIVKFSESDGSVRLSDAAVKEWKERVDKSEESQPDNSTKGKTKGSGGGGSWRRKVLFH